MRRSGAILWDGIRAFFLGVGMDELTKIERTHEVRSGLMAALTAVRELTWDVKASETSPGEGWESFAVRKHNILWRRPKSPYDND